MNRIFIISMIVLLAGCSSHPDAKKQEQNSPSEPTTVVSDDYELIIPEQQDALLILFPCFPCDAQNTRSEFDIVDEAIEKHIAVLLMNFNQRLWLTEAEKKNLEKTIAGAVSEHGIKTSNTFVGGFSSGGNISLLLTDYLHATESSIQPKGLFIVDSPIDLLSLYENAQKTIERNFSELAIQEANWIIDRLESAFGAGDSALASYTRYSPYIFKTHATNNLSHLTDVSIRLYSEPDTLWWRENRQASYENMNAFYIEQLADDLGRIYGKEKLSYIRTENRGYRANGERHPHSWSIVDEKDLVKWLSSK